MNARPLAPRLAHPALFLAAAAAAGIVLGTYGGAAWTPAWWALGGGALVVPVVLRRAWRRRLVSLLGLARSVSAAVALVAAGALRAAPGTLPADHLARYVPPGTDVSGEVEGRIVGAPVRRRSGTRLVVSVRRGRGPGGEAPLSGRVQVTLGRPRWSPPPEYPALRAGDVVRIAGRLRAPPGRRNPADFDYGAYLRRQGIHATLSVYRAADVRRLGRAPGLSDRIAAPLRAHVEAALAAHVPDVEARAVLAALLLGDRGGLGDDVRERFARTGLLHLLAVSGLHVLLVGMVLHALLGPSLARLGLGWRAREIGRTTATLAVLAAYVLVTGAPASVVRAFVMAAVFLGGVLLQRPARPMNTLGAAALVLLLARPAYLFEAGFQLSFAAVAGIVGLHRVLSDAVPAALVRRRAGRYVAESVVTSLAATLATLPVLLYHFGQVGLAGIVLNVPAIPLTAGTLAAGLAAVGTHGILPHGAAVFGAAADALARLLLAVAAAGERGLGWTTLYTRVETLWIVGALMCIPLTLAAARSPRFRWRTAATGAACAAVGIWSGVTEGQGRARLDVVFFDVGQGDAALVSLPNGRRLLIDAGVDEGTARYVLRPHLARYGIRRLDAVVASHPHRDHVGGLPALLRAVPVGRILHNGAPGDAGLDAATHRVADSLGIPRRGVVAGDTLSVDPRVRLQVLGPGTARRADEPNEASVVLRLAYGRTTWLFTGDAEHRAESDVVRRFQALLPADVVKVGHHGSRTSSTAPFVAAATAGGRPVTAVVSVARRNSYGLPDEDVLQRWRAAGADVRLTARRGAVWLRSDGRTVRSVPWHRTN